MQCCVICCRIVKRQLSTSTDCTTHKYIKIAGQRSQVNEQSDPLHFLRVSASEQKEQQVERIKEWLKDQRPKKTADKSKIKSSSKLCQDSLKLCEDYNCMTEENVDNDSDDDVSVSGTLDSDLESNFSTVSVNSMRDVDENDQSTKKYTELQPVPVWRNNANNYGLAQFNGINTNPPQVSYETNTQVMNPAIAHAHSVASVCGEFASQVKKPPVSSTVCNSYNMYNHYDTSSHAFHNNSPLPTNVNFECGQSNPNLPITLQTNAEVEQYKTYAYPYTHANYNQLSGNFTSDSHNAASASNAGAYPYYDTHQTQNYDNFHSQWGSHHNFQTYNHHDNEKMFGYNGVHNNSVVEMSAYAYNYSPYQNFGTSQREVVTSNGYDNAIGVGSTQWVAQECNGPAQNSTNPNCIAHNSSVYNTLHPTVVYDPIHNPNVKECDVAHMSEQEISNAHGNVNMNIADNYSMRTAGFDVQGQQVNHTSLAWDNVQTAQVDCQNLAEGVNNVHINYSAGLCDETSHNKNVNNGMNKIDGSNHNASVYHVSTAPTSSHLFVSNEQTMQRCDESKPEVVTKSINLADTNNVCKTVSNNQSCDSVNNYRRKANLSVNIPEGINDPTCSTYSPSSDESQQTVDVKQIFFGEGFFNDLMEFSSYTPLQRVHPNLTNVSK